MPDEFHCSLIEVLVALVYVKPTAANKGTFATTDIGGTDAPLVLVATKVYVKVVTACMLRVSVKNVVGAWTTARVTGVPPVRVIA